MTQTNLNTSHVKASKGPLRILVVEDNAINLRLITAALLRAGHKVDSAMDGAAALVQFQNNVYDAILMDLSLIHI